MIRQLQDSDKAEISRFTDTGKTIVHRGRSYAILNPPDDEHRADSPFILRSQKGNYYALVRNKPNPHALFAISLYGGRCKCLPGWFTDRTGELVSIG